MISDRCCVKTHVEISKFNHFLVINLMKFHQICDFCCQNTRVGVLCWPRSLIEFNKHGLMRSEVCLVKSDEMKSLYDSFAITSLVGTSPTNQKQPSFAQSIQTGAYTFRILPSSPIKLSPPGWGHNSQNGADNVVWH